jgi:hypothetical protein
MKKVPYFLSILFLSTLIFSLGSCNKEDNSDTFQTILDKGGVFDDPMNSTTKSVTVDTVVNGDSLWACTTETYSVVQGMQEFPLFNPNSSVIYPGNLLQGGTLKNATPDVIVVDRAGGTFSIDILSGSWNISKTVNEVVKSEVIQALNDIVSDASYGAIPSNISFSMQEVHSEQQMALSLGLDFTAYGVALSSNLGFSSNNNYNRVLVRLSQSYYTMSFDLPASYDDLFAPTVTPADLQLYVGAGNPACYISDVTYGRVFYLLVESTSNTSNITSSINASFSSIPNSPSANINASYLSSLENLNIKLFALGGDASTTLYTISSTNVNNLVSVLGAAGDITTGVPLSYVCRAVNGNKIVSVNLATAYDIDNCAPIGPIVGDYGVAVPVLELAADDAILSNNGIISYVKGNNVDQHTYQIGSSFGQNIGGSVVESWPGRNGVNIATSSDPNNRPVFVNDAVNGYPAIEFCNFEADGYGSGSTYDQNISTSMEIPGGLFANSNYTLFVVVANPTKLNVSGDNINNMNNESIDAGSILQGSDTLPFGKLTVGFSSNSNLIFGHNMNDLNVPISRSSDFRLLTLQFSTQEGMKAYINNHQNPVAEDNSLNIPLTSNNGLMLNSMILDNPSESSRTLVAEIKLYDVALNDFDRNKQITKLMAKYNL